MTIKLIYILWYSWSYTIYNYNIFVDNHFLRWDEWCLLTESFLEILCECLDSYLVLLLLCSLCRCFSRLWCLSCRLFLCFLCLWLSYLFWYFLGMCFSSSSASSSALPDSSESPLNFIGLLIGLNCESEFSRLDECDAAEAGERLRRLFLWWEDRSTLEDRKRFFDFLGEERSILSPFLSNNLLEK